MGRNGISAFCSHTLTLGKKFHSELASSINQSGCSQPPPYAPGRVQLRSTWPPLGCNESQLQLFFLLVFLIVKAWGFVLATACPQ